MCPPPTSSSLETEFPRLELLLPANPPPPPPSFIPTTPLSVAAYTLASTNLPLPILHHSLRVYLYALHLATNSPTTPYPAPISSLSLSPIPLFLACILHDLGASSPNPHPFNDFQRFEICGADAAHSLMSSSSYLTESTPAERLDIWSAISLHTSPGIAERLSPLTRLVRLAVLCDFSKNVSSPSSGSGGEAVSGEMRREVEGRFPRLEVDRVLGDVVVMQVLGKEVGEGRALKGPGGSWVGGMVRSFEVEGNGEDGVNRAF